MSFAQPRPRGKRHDLQLVGRALVEISAAGLLPELIDQIAVVRERHRDERHGRTIGQQFAVGHLARDLSRITGLGRAASAAAIADALSPDWSAIACATIMDFAARMTAGRARR